ncbi:MAG: universal stress protein [Saprospiraceae bacterium]|nr:universal stress protein [Saprospiraceae bacterium]
MNILCPTDFSENSQFAIEYAINLTNVTGGKLHFLTSFTVPRSTGNFRSLDLEIRQTVEAELNEFVQPYLNLIKTGLEPVIVVMEGNPGNAILSYSERNHVDLIIMGTQGSTNLATLLLGSVTKKVFENTTVPVLAIPSIVRETLTGNRMLLSLDDAEVKNLKIFNLVRYLKDKLEVDLDIIHISKPDQMIAFSNNTTAALSDITREIIELVDEDPVSRIKQYVDNSDVGILIMIRRYHTFWERLFLQTNTTAELFASNVPILMLPE